MIPCAFWDCCECYNGECTVETAKSCGVIVKPKAEPEKLWNPEEPVAVTLTKEQWQAVCWELMFCRSVAKAKALEYAIHPAHAYFAEDAAKHHAAAEKIGALIAEVERQLGWDKETVLT